MFPGFHSSICHRCRQYRIAGNFWERKLSQIGEKYDFWGENLRRLLTCDASKETTPTNFVKKLLQIATIPRNSRKLWYLLYCKDILMAKYWRNICCNHFVLHSMCSSYRGNFKLYQWRFTAKRWNHFSTRQSGDVLWGTVGDSVWWSLGDQWC